ncbi:MAG TPA: hypothetical protein VN088_18695 [Nocardioides sp.]|nr:hypothetical protein [Nocardioides sp.]
MSRGLTIDDPDLQHLLRRRQDGIVARSQLLQLGAAPNDIRRLLRRRDLVQRHPGVYSAHSGGLSRPQLEWVGVLAAWPAALGFESALPEHGGRVVQVVVAPGRAVSVPAGVVVARRSGLREVVDWRAAPPRVQLQHAALDTMERSLRRGDVAAAFETLSIVLHSRRTSVDEIQAALAARGRFTSRATATGLLDDARTGACSVLERGYLHRVERAHGLPRATRQRPSTATGKPTAQDVRYDEYGLIVELDGRAFHDSPRARDADAARDLAELAAHNDATARVTYGLVFRDACTTAARIATILQRRGWRGEACRCAGCH